MLTTCSMLTTCRSILNNEEAFIFMTTKSQNSIRYDSGSLITFLWKQMIPRYLQTRFPALLACKPPNKGVLIVSKHIDLFINNVCALYRNVTMPWNVITLQFNTLRPFMAVLFNSFMFLSSSQCPSIVLLLWGLTKMRNLWLDMLYWCQYMSCA